MCFGYCLTERKNTQSRAITGFCEEWLKQIGQCSKGILISYINKFVLRIAIHFNSTNRKMYDPIL